MSSINCPPSQILNRYVRGELSVDEADLLVEHLDTCVDCDHTLAKLESNVVLPLREQNPARVCFADEPQCRELVGKLQDRGASRRDRFRAEMSEPPDRIRDYELLERIGQGAIGVVFRARHSHLNKLVAIKLLMKRTGEDEAIEARFQREMRAVGSLEHPHIVRALDAGICDGNSFLVMELVDGIDIARLASSHDKLPVADACEIARQAALGLHHAHQQGLVHRDVKPSNLMLTCPNNNAPLVKVLDLGLATIQDQADELHLTDAGQLMGTLEYMAPEQAEDTRCVDHRADIYSLGATLYRLLTGHLPFCDRDYQKPAQRLRALTQSAPPSVATQRDGLPPELVELVDQMLSRDPAARPATMREIATRLAVFSSPHRLDALLDEQNLKRSPEPQRIDPSHSTPAEHVRSEPSQTLAAGRPHKRRLFILIVFLLLSVSAGIMWVRSNQGHIELKSVDSSAKPAIVISAGTSPKRVDTVSESNSNQPTPPHADDERELARQIIASGGVVVFVDSETGKATSQISQIEDFPQGPFTIREIHWSRPDARRFSESGRLTIQAVDGQTGITNEAIGRLMKLLATCEDLRHLGLQTTDGRVTDHAVKHLSELSQLTSLMIGFPLLTNNGLDSLTDNTTLKELWIVSPRFTDRIWDKLAAMEHLESITVSAAGSDQKMWLTGVGISILRDHPKLNKLSIQSCKLSDAGVREIGQLTQLEHLDLYNTSLNDDHIRHLADLRGLKSLGVLETQVTQTGVAFLKQVLPNCQISAGEVQ